MRDVRQAYQEIPSTRGYRSNTCFAPGCFLSTREGKPFCPDHVEENPYVVGIRVRLNQRHAELSNIAEGKTPKGPILFEEILLLVRVNGPRTVNLLSRETQLDFEVIKKVVLALKRKGLIRTTVSGRGLVIVEAI